MKDVVLKYVFRKTFLKSIFKKCLQKALLENVSKNLFCALIRLELLVIYCSIGVTLFLHFLVAPADQVGFLKESSEKDKVAEVHGQAEFDVDWRDVTIGLATLQVLVSGDIYDAANNHLC